MFDWTVDTPVKEIIQQAIGAGSVCWEFPEKAGLFNVEMARKIADEAVEILNQKSIR